MIDIGNGVTITDSVWFSTPSGETIGVVFVDVKHVGQKAYIGVASGYDKTIDAIHIINTGGRFSLGVAIKIAQHLENEAP